MNPSPTGGSDKALPASIEAERAVLGSILLNRDAILAVASDLSPDDFYVEQHAWIYGAMRAVLATGMPPDTQIVSNELRRTGRLELIGGVPALCSLVDAVPTSYHIEYYARIVIQTAVLRRLIAVGGKIAGIGYDEPDLTAAIDRARSMVETLAARVEIDTRYQPRQLSDLLAKEVPPVRWVVENILPEGLTLLAGKPKLGKSWLALGLGLAVASGGKVIGHIAVTQADVLYLALEDNERRLKKRIQKLAPEGLSPTLPFWYETTWPPLASGGLTRLDTWLTDHPAVKLVVVDTLGRARGDMGSRAGTYGDDYVAMADFKAVADKHGVAILGVHHRTKADTEDYLDSVSGSTGLIGAVDGFIVLERTRGAVEASLHVTGRDIEFEQEIALLWDAVTAQWTSAGDAQEFRHSREREEILELFRDAGEPLGPRDIADATGKQRNAVYQALKRLADAGALVRADMGRYKLPDGNHDSMTPMTPLTPPNHKSHGSHGSHGVMKPASMSDRSWAKAVAAWQAGNRATVLSVASESRMDYTTLVAALRAALGDEGESDAAAVVAS